MSLAESEMGSQKVTNEVKEFILTLSFLLGIEEKYFFSGVLLLLARFICFARRGKY
jgi:hypothetical protein